MQADPLFGYFSAVAGPVSTLYMHVLQLQGMSLKHAGQFHWPKRNPSKISHENQDQQAV